MGGKAASSEGRSAGARLHEVPGLEEVAAAAGKVGTRRPRARRHAPGAQGGNRDGAAAGVGGVCLVLELAMPIVVPKKWWHSWIPRVLGESLRQSQLERTFTALKDDFATKFEGVRTEGEEQDLVNEWHRISEWPGAKLAEIKTEKLLRRAERRGINLYADQSWWTELEHQYGPTQFLTDPGLSQAKRLLKDDFLKSVKDWVQICSQVAMMLIALGGMVIAILNSR